MQSYFIHNVWPLVIMRAKWTCATWTARRGSGWPNLPQRQASIGAIVQIDSELAINLKVPTACNRSWSCLTLCARHSHCSTTKEPPPQKKINSLTDEQGGRAGKPAMCWLLWHADCRKSACTLTEIVPLVTETMVSLKKSMISYMNL